MTTLTQIFDATEEFKGRNIYIAYITGLVKEWLQQKPVGKFPRLNNYPDDATKIQLIEYVEKLTDWCQRVEEREFELLEELPDE